MTRLTRRRLITSAGLAAPALLLGCDRTGPGIDVKKLFLNSGEWFAEQAHRRIGSNALAREFAPEDISPVFRTNGTTRPKTAAWEVDAETGFDRWQLKIDGLVDRPGLFTLAQIEAMPVRSQITRHDCVEGWSAIAEWHGVPLKYLIEAVGLKSDAKYLVFWCADVIRGWQYYESIDLIEAFHPQTILAYGMNGEPLPVKHGAPVRLRVERQLGYKHAKFVMRIEAVADLTGIGEGRGGFWEDASGYEWYAGI